MMSLESLGGTPAKLLVRNHTHTLQPFLACMASCYPFLSRLFENQDPSFYCHAQKVLFTWTILWSLWVLPPNLAHMPRTPKLACLCPPKCPFLGSQREEQREEPLSCGISKVS